MRQYGQMKNLKASLLTWPLLVALLACLGVVDRAVFADPVTCVTCHTEQAAELGGSVHGSLGCQECHGGAAKYDMASSAAAALTNPDLSGSLSGRFDHGAGFKGKADRAGVPNLCGDCHANVERMNPYGIRTDQLSRYWASGHGKALRDNGETRAAVCIDCHGSHGVLSGRDPNSSTYPLHIPDTCGVCHTDADLMGEFDLPVAVVDEYRASVHGQLLLEQGDTGAPTCATCHGNHSAMPPGHSSVGSVCGQCHQHAAKNFATSIHAQQEDHRGCVQCHGGGEGSSFHLVERITKPPGVLIQRYAHLLASEPNPTPQQVHEAIHPAPKQIITRALSTCLDCHDEVEDDENLSKMFDLMDAIGKAERYYVRTANRLEDLSEGVLVVEAQQFKFQEAKTHLIELAPLQHTLNNTIVSEKVTELNEVCDEVNAELDKLEAGLSQRYGALVPIWVFSFAFSALLYVKYKRLKSEYVKPMPSGWKKWSS